MNPLRWVWKGIQKVAARVTRDQHAAQAGRLRPYLAGDMPGFWASNHDEEVRHYTGFTYCAVSALADQAAQATCAVHRVRAAKKVRGGRVNKSASAQHEQGGADRTPLPDDFPLTRLLNRPNPGQSGRMFRYECMLQLRLTGTCHVWKVCNGFGVPVELYVLPTASAVPLPPSWEHPRGAYRISPLASFSGLATDDFMPPGSLGPLLVAGGIIDARDVKSIRLPHPLYRSDGWSPLAAGALDIDLEEQLKRSRWYKMKNASKPGLVFEVDEDANPSPEEMEAFRQDVKNRTGGTQNTGENLLLPPGIKGTKVTESAVEMDYTGAFPQARDTTLAYQKTPAVAIGVAEAGSYSAFYASLMQFTELAVQPSLDMIADELTEDLGPAFEKVGRQMGVLQKGDRLEISLRARAVNDPSQVEARIHTDISAKAITINEVRALRGMPPVKWGDCPAGTDPLQWQQQKAQMEQGGQPGFPAPLNSAGGDPFAELFGNGPGEGQLKPAGGGGQQGQDQQQEQGKPGPFDTGTSVPVKNAPPGREEIMAKALNGFHWEGNGHAARTQ